MPADPIEFFRVEVPSSRKWDAIKVAGQGGWRLEEQEELPAAAMGQMEPDLRLQFSRIRSRSDRQSGGRAQSMKDLFGL